MKIQQFFRKARDKELARKRKAAEERRQAAARALQKSWRRYRIKKKKGAGEDAYNLTFARQFKGALGGFWESPPHVSRQTDSPPLDLCSVLPCPCQPTSSRERGRERPKPSSAHVPTRN